MTEQPPPPPGNYPPPPPPGGGYPPPPPPGGGYPPPPPGGGYPPHPGGARGYPPPPPSGAPGYWGPPQGGYPPPPGSYPPPQGGYPPRGGYPPAGGPGFGGTQAFSIGDAFSWAWSKFSGNAVALIVPTLVYGLILGAIQMLFSFLSAAVQPADVTSYTSDGDSFAFSYSLSSPGAILVAFIGWIVVLVVVAAIQSAYISGMLDIANGQQVTIGSFFKPRNIGDVIIASLIVGILTSIGFALCVLPGIVVVLFTLFTIVALLDRNLSAVDAIKTSFNIAKSNFGQVLLTLIVMVAIAIVGALLCLVGLLVAIPVVTLIEVYAYRKLTGGQVADLNPQPLPPRPQPQAGPPPHIQ